MKTFTDEQIKEIAREAIDALCNVVQTAVGQTDGGFASIYFSGGEIEEMIESYVRSEIRGLNFMEQEKNKSREGA